MKHKDGRMQVPRLPDLRRRKDSNTLQDLKAQGGNNRTMARLLNNTISTRTTTATVMMMVTVGTDTTKDTGNSTMT